MATAIQAIYIREHEERPTPKPHTVYKIEIQANSTRSWQMWRRYSEFTELHTDLAKATGSPPPANLPPKHPFSLSNFIPNTFAPHEHAAKLEERRAGLETYLRAIISAKEDKWRDAVAFRDFLGIPAGKAGTFTASLPSQFTSISWLDEHIAIQALIRDIRADINKRDALSDRGDISGSQKANLSAKQTLAGVLNRIQTLASGLKELGMSGMSEGELNRRVDMVARCKDDADKLQKMVVVARVAGIGGINFERNPASDKDRQALLGNGSPPGRGLIKPVKRVFGAPPPAQETDETRPLDNVGVMGLQQMQIETQDQQLSQLSSILLRQKHLAGAIGNELATQNELLDQLIVDVDATKDRLKVEQKQLNRLNK